jgi:gas vesicle protein
MAEYDRYDSESSGGFMMGLLTGVVLGAGIGMLLAPKPGSELRGTLGEQARNLGERANEGYRRASETAGTWAERGKEMVTQARDAVSRGAEEARGYVGTTTGSAYNAGSGAAGGNSSGGTSFGDRPAGSTTGDYGRT